jgi:hypothetical protein
MTRLLTHEIYTTAAIRHGLSAFAPHCKATVQHGADESLLTIADDPAIASELLNYILTLSAQELLA